MPRAKTTTPTAEDPLADLRSPEDDTARYPEDVAEGPLEDLEAPDPALALTEAISAAVAAWHRDPTAVGFVHKGQSCGCWYLARLILEA